MCDDTDGILHSWAHVSLSRICQAAISATLQDPVLLRAGMPSAMQPIVHSDSYGSWNYPCLRHSERQQMKLKSDVECKGARCLNFHGTFSRLNKTPPSCWQEPLSQDLQRQNPPPLAGRVGGIHVAQPLSNTTTLHPTPPLLERLRLPNATAAAPATRDRE